MILLWPMLERAAALRTSVRILAESASRFFRPSSSVKISSVERSLPEGAERCSLC